MSKDSIKQMVVVAGTTCCGKTRFINQLMSGKLKNIEELIKINDFKSWVYQDAYYLKPATLEKRLKYSKKNIIFHWTIPLPDVLNSLRNVLLLNSYDKKCRIEFVKSAKKVTVFSLYADPHTLMDRVKLRERRVQDQLREKEINIIRKLWMLQNIKTAKKFYSDPARYLPAYKKWFDFIECSLRPKSHFLVDNNYLPLIRDIDDWRKIIALW